MISTKSLLIYAAEKLQAPETLMLSTVAKMFNLLHTKTGRMSLTPTESMARPKSLHVGVYSGNEETIAHDEDYLAYLI